MFSRAAFYPTLLYNVVIERLGLVDWYTRIDDVIILGALPFRSTAEKVGEIHVLQPLRVNWLGYALVR